MDSMAQDQGENGNGQSEITKEVTLEELITLKEASQYSDLSYSHLRYLARQGMIWAKRLGNSWVTTQSAVNNYLAQDRRPGPKPKREPDLNSKPS